MTERRPSRRLLLVWVLYALPAVGLFVILSVLLWHRTSVPLWAMRVFTGCWITLVILGAGYLPLRFRRISFIFQSDRVLVRGGVFFRLEKMVPLSGLRHITLLYGPAERLFHIASLVLYTAGGMVLLEGLPIGEARALQRRLLTATETEAGHG